MTELIGARLITRLKDAPPPATEYTISDTRLRGFYIRIRTSGRISYYCQLGRGKKIKIGDADEIKPNKARDIAEDHIANFKKGIDPIAERKKAKAGTLKDFIDDKYAEWVEANRKTGKATVARLRSCFPDLMKTPIAELTPWQIDKWRTARLKEGRKASTVNRDITALKAALSKAVEWGTLEAHPLAKVKPKRVDRSGKVRFLTEDEEARLRKALEDRTERMRSERDRYIEWREQRGYPPFPSLRNVRFTDHLEPMILLSINTGLRRGEMFNLSWQDVDLSAAILTIRGDTAKSGETRHIPLNAEALAALKSWREQTKGSDLVFPGKKGKPMDNIKKAWSALLKDAGICEFRWHDLRHHFASRLVMAGVALNTVRELLGHSDLKMTLRYAHLAPAHKAAAVALLDAVQEKKDAI